MTRELTRMSPLFRLLSNTRTKKSAVELQIQFYKFENASHRNMQMLQLSMCSHRNEIVATNVFLGIKLFSL